MAADYRHIGALRIDLVGTTADFRHPGPRRPLPLNHLLGENPETAGRIGEVREDTPAIQAPGSGSVKRLVVGQFECNNLYARCS